VLLIDPLSNDPLVCSGSANFSKNSLTANDENMLLIRGNTRTADIYMTELDRIFRHFRARDIINATPPPISTRTCCCSIRQTPGSS
jgi:phosphatidylserine/phosphatidylglycerophosphate/cardiolipin synthase-like enzyme